MKHSNLRHSWGCRKYLLPLDVCINKPFKPFVRFMATALGKVNFSTLTIEKYSTSSVIIYCKFNGSFQGMGESF